MNKVVNPELLLLVGYMVLKVISTLFSNRMLGGFVGVIGGLLLLLGAAGIARRHRSSQITLIIGFIMLSTALFVSKVLTISSQSLITTGTLGGYLVLIAIVTSWGISMQRKARRKTKKV